MRLRFSPSTRYAGIALAILPLAVTARAQDQSQPTAAASATAGFLVNDFQVRYTRQHPDLPSAESVLQARIELVESADGWRPPSEGETGREFTLAEFAKVEKPRLTERGLASVFPAVLRRFQDLGLGGVLVLPEPAEFVVDEGRAVDKRPAGAGVLTLQIITGFIGDVRTTAQGERVRSEEKVNNPLHAAIRLNSPVQARQPDDTRPPDLYRKSEVEDYMLRLSRHPGRRVDGAAYPYGDQPGAIALDYLITENKPWLLFAQVSSTGTSSTSRIREHFGFVHNNLTNNDDILGIGYHTASFKDSHTIYASYEAPIWNFERWRFRVFGQGYTYDASEVGFAGASFEGDGWSMGAEAICNFYQRGSLFLDSVVGAQFKHVSVDNNLAAISGSDNFFVPHAKVRLERHREKDRTDAEAGIEFNIAGLAGTDEPLDALGRSDATADWIVLKGRASHSLFLEPLLSRSGEPNAMAHELAFTFEGQHALGNRLIPNETFSAGGLYTVRGYEESIAAADTGYFASAEYRYHVARNLKPDPTPGALFGRPFRFVPQYQYGPVDWDWVLKGFVDVGRVVNSDRLSFEKDQTLLGIGIGTEIAYKRNISLRVDWGIALNELTDAAGNTLTDQGDNELHFILTLVY